MSPSTPTMLRTETEELLASDGYVRVPSPFAISQIAFDIEGVYTGPEGTLSLAVVQDGPSSREDAGTIYWRVQRLVRALDAEDSRLSVTVVLIAGRPDDRLVADLQTIARVLLIDGTMGTRRMLAPLMSLKSTSTLTTFSNGLDSLAEFIAARPRAAGLETLIVAASGGVQSVEAAYLHWLDQGLERGL
jgi:hypothetical protein